MNQGTRGALKVLGAILAALFVALVAGVLMALSSGGKKKRSSRVRDFSGKHR